MNESVYLYLGIAGILIGAYAAYRIWQHQKNLRARLISLVSVGDIPAIRKAGEKRIQAAIPQLVSALDHPKDGSRTAAAKALEQMGWVPPDTPTAMKFEYCRDWEKLFCRGQPALEMLLANLKDRRLDVRRRAAEALVAWSLKADIDAKTKQAILARKTQITQKHTDRHDLHTDEGRRGHVDHTPSSDCSEHHDYIQEHRDTPGGHTDAGIGLKMPL